MKKIIIFLFLLNTFFCKAQIDTLPTIVNEKKNFFGLRESAILDTLKNFERIYLEDKIMVFRHFFPNTKVVFEEYFYVEKDTFFYVKYYDVEHKIVEKGKLFPKKCCAFIDTLDTFNPETYEEQRIIEKYLLWSKEGYWLENKTDYGNYSENHRIGEWFVFDEKTKNANYFHYDNKGNFQNIEPYNIIEAKSKEKTLERLQGRWEVRHPTHPTTKISLWKTDDNKDEYAYLTFNKDSVTIKFRLKCGTGLKITKPIKNIFIINDNNEISLDIMWFENRKYKITYLSRYEMEWELIE